MLSNKNYEFDLQFVAKKIIAKRTKIHHQNYFFNQEFMKNANDQLVPLSNLKLCNSKKAPDQTLFPFSTLPQCEIIPSIENQKFPFLQKIGNFQMKAKKLGKFFHCLLKQTPFDFHLESYPSSKIRGQM